MAFSRFEPMELNLTKPIIFIDLETTGINIATDRIIEISMFKVKPDDQTEILTERVNPTIPVSEQSFAVHGISDQELADKPTFNMRAPAYLNFIGNSDLAGYNAIKFDIPLLVEEFLRADIDFEIKGRRLVDVQNIFHKMEPRNLSAAYRFYCNKELEDAHSAEADALATFEILKSQLDRYNGVAYEEKDGKLTTPIENDINKLSEFSYHTKNADLVGQIIFNDKGEEIFNFGKYKGRSVEKQFKKEPQYYDWMMKSHFPLSTKKVITSIYLRGFNKESVNMK